MGHNYKQILENIMTRSDELNDWEVNFIASIHDWLILQDKPLTDRQKETVIKINRKYICKR